MKSILCLAVAVVFCGTASSQVLSEDLSSGVPPTGWIHVDNNAAGGQGWIADSMGRAWHEDEYLGGLSSDNTLISPTFDLSGVTGSTLTFDGETNYATYLANNPAGYGDGVSNMELTTDGGLTWTVVWTDTSLVNGTYAATADLSSFDGMTGVQLGIHFFGTYAQEWWVDNVVIDGGGGTSFTLSATGLVSGGTATVSLAGATPGGDVLIGYSFTGAGPNWTPYGMVDIGGPIKTLPIQVADGGGNVSITAGVAVRIANHTLYAQAVDLSSGTLSNSIAEPIL